VSYIAWRRKHRGICKVCKALVANKRSRFIVCTQDLPERILWVANGHLTNKVAAMPLPKSGVKENLHFQARLLYSARRQRIWVGAAIAEREREGKTVSHLRELMSMNRNYSRELVRVLDDLGWLGSVERIVRRMCGES
jgi:hypothetical protein